MSTPTKQDAIKLLDVFDPEMATLLHREEKRQFETIGLIASENVVSPMAACLEGSVFTNKNTEGYAGKRFVGGCELADQAELLAKEVAARLSLPLAATLRKANRKPLSRLEGSRSIRSARILGAYSLAQGVDVAGKQLLLVDDIVTSGATLNECARVLKTAGAARIICVALARKRDG